MRQDFLRTVGAQVGVGFDEVQLIEKDLLGGPCELYERLVADLATTFHGEMMNGHGGRLAASLYLKPDARKQFKIVDGSPLARTQKLQVEFVLLRKRWRDPIRVRGLPHPHDPVAVRDHGSGIEPDIRYR